MEKIDDFRVWLFCVLYLTVDFISYFYKKYDIFQNEILQKSERSEVADKILDNSKFAFWFKFHHICEYILYVVVRLLQIIFSYILVQKILNYFENKAKFEKRKSIVAEKNFNK